jgi:hypothetical protein
MQGRIRYGWGYSCAVQIEVPSVLCLVRHHSQSTKHSRILNGRSTQPNLTRTDSHPTSLPLGTETMSLHSRYARSKTSAGAQSSRRRRRSIVWSTAGTSIGGRPECWVRGGRVRGRAGRGPVSGWRVVHCRSVSTGNWKTFGSRRSGGLRRRERTGRLRGRGNHCGTRRG